MIQITLTMKKKKFHKNPGKAKLAEESLLKILRTQGVKNCPILCVRLKTMAVFRPEKKEVDPQKL